MVQKCNKVQPKHGKVTQNMHEAFRNSRYVWDISVTPVAHETVNTGKQSTSKHSITTEHHTIKKGTHNTTT